MLAPPYHQAFHVLAGENDERITVYAAPIICAPLLDTKPQPLHLAFAVYWDEDRDRRVLRLADVLHHHNVLTDFLAFHEHEGMLQVVLKSGLSSARVAQVLTVLDGACISDSIDDSWTWEGTNFESDLHAPGSLTLTMGQVFNYDELVAPFDRLAADSTAHKLGGLLQVDEYGEPL